MTCVIQQLISLSQHFLFHTALPDSPDQMVPQKYSPVHSHIWSTDFNLISTKPVKYHYINSYSWFPLGWKGWNANPNSSAECLNTIPQRIRLSHFSKTRNPAIKIMNGVNPTVSCTIRNLEILSLTMELQQQCAHLGQTKQTKGFWNIKVFPTSHPVEGK